MKGLANVPNPWPIRSNLGASGSVEGFVIEAADQGFPTVPLVMEAKYHAAAYIGWLEAYLNKLSEPFIKSKGRAILGRLHGGMDMVFVI